MFTLKLRRPGRSFVLALLALSLLGGCGGVETGGTGAAVAVGPINGFGSIIVNGVHYDDSAAVVQNDDGVVLSRDQLKLGVTTVVDASGLTGSAGNQRAAASSIRIGSELIGPVGTVDPTTSTFTVLGQTVLVTPDTVFDAGLPGGLSGLSVGTVVEIYGRYDQARSRYAATRIEPRPNPAFYKLRGVISAVDAQAKRLTIGGQAINYGQISAADMSNVAVGNLVRAKLQLTTDSGVWNASALAAAVTQLPDSEEASVEGRISAWVSSRQFSVDGIPVDASAASFPGGEAAVLLGARVEIIGGAAGGVLRAQVVNVEGDESVSNSSFELVGPIDTLDAAAKTFTLHGVTVDYSGAVQYQYGAASDLAVGRNVQVEGILSSDGSRIEAQSITFLGS